MFKSDEKIAENLILLKIEDYKFIKSDINYNIR